MEALTKKTISIEFGGKKYALDNNTTIENFITDLGIAKSKIITLKSTKDGFILSVNN